MAQKPKMPCVFEGKTNGFEMVHYAPDALSGNVTLCGITDWLDEEDVGSGDDHDGPATCGQCVSIWSHCNQYRANEG
jgi:hypothetical protein